MGLTLAIDATDEYRWGHSIIMPLATAKRDLRSRGLDTPRIGDVNASKHGAPLGRPTPDYLFQKHGPQMAHEDLKPELTNQWYTASLDSCRSWYDNVKRADRRKRRDRGMGLEQTSSLLIPSESCYDRRTLQS